MKYIRKSSIFVLAAALVLFGAGCQSQRTFSSPDAAVAALKDAVKMENKKELRQLFGSHTEELKTGDPDQDREDFLVFARKLEAKHTFEQVAPDHLTLLVGEDQWPFAVPLVNTGNAWQFDTDAGIEEIDARNIGRNELRTIAACRTVIDAQAEFFERDPDGLGVKHYAQRLMSTQGAKDGLYWPVTGNEEPSPIGPVLAQAATRTDDRGARIPYQGYRYKLLLRQGDGAPRGAMNYDTGGKLTSGWAAIAYPAEYGVTGVMTFMFGHGGVVFEKDLGPDTDRIANAITAFDPGSDWKRSE